MTDTRIAIVTGASRGIGRAIALRLARDGRHVVCVARSQGPLDELVAEITSAGGRATAKPCDLADAGAVAAMVESVASELGRIDILVNNAGITRDNLILRMSDDEWDDVVNTNLKAVFVACRAAARPMMKGKFGRIVNIASTSGLVGNAGQANYAAAKSGLTGLTKTIARELGGKGITANVIAPGFVQTDMTKDLPQQVIDGVKAMMAVRQLGTPEDIAAAVAYATSDEAGFLTGQTIAVDGGMTMC
ncbi:MAG: 3-oxoacyl-[acyl-carrier-protein] reductase [Phycisphaerales bacterium]|nr:3-oxoacyl-[acyl-carrier-protein] reductase [Planctomycetota bacterium]MCH8508913.1 3-oxoacyl-[acyl-carrier-protein] reductase [Phycisphaerales bacterium]